MCQNLVLAFCVLTLQLSAANVVFGEKITDKALGFTLHIPSDFVARPELAASQPDMVYAFVSQQKDEDDFPEVCMIEKLGGTLPPGGFDGKKMAARLNAEHFATTWQGHQVDAFIMRQPVNGIDTVTYMIQIPLRRQAIQLHLLGLASEKEKVGDLFDQILAGFQGESNWSSSTPSGTLPSGTWSSAPSSTDSTNRYGKILLGIGIGGIVAGLVALMIASRWLPQGGVLVIAIAVYYASWNIPGERTREVQMLRGATRMFGVAAGVLGLVDLVRRRKPKKGSAIATLAQETVVVAEAPSKSQGP
jgi:hypothetical protein